MIRFLKHWYHLFLAFVGALYFGFPGKKLTIVGVTGTDGKTTTTTLLYEIVKAAGFHVSMITSVKAVIAGKSYDTGFHVTTPSAFWVQKYLREAVDHGDTHVILEVTSHGISQFRVWGIPFFMGIITNVTHEHLDWHRTYEEYLQTKLKLLQWSQTAIVNKDESVLYEQAMKILGKNHTLITYGLKSQAMVNPSSYNVKTNLPGTFNLYNCLAALAGAIGLSIEPEKALGVIETFSGISGRMETIIEKPFHVIVDFAHTPNAIEQALSTVRMTTKKKLIHVFGSAGLRDSSKRKIMGEASGKFADLIILTEEDYRTEKLHDIMDMIQGGIPTKVKVVRIDNRGDAIRYALKKAKRGDAVIITGKGHEKSLCRGRVECPWSDQETVKQIVHEEHIV